MTPPLADLEPADLDAPVAQTLAAMPPGTLDHFDLVSRVDVRTDLAKVHRPGQEETVRAAVGSGPAAPKVIPKRRDGRSLPPE